MAMADYRLCDVCERKAFYDSNLNYEFASKSEPIPDGESIKYLGVVTRGQRLDYLGDWAVLCRDCAKTHRTQIVPIEATASKEQP